MKLDDEIESAVTNPKEYVLALAKEVFNEKNFQMEQAIKSRILLIKTNGYFSLNHEFYLENSENPNHHRRV